MKKLLLAASIVFGGSALLTALPETSLQAEAKEYQMKSNLAKNLKKGTFPGANGKIGLLRKNLKIKNEGDLWYDPHVVSGTLYGDSYMFKPYGGKPNSKVILIERNYGYLISNASIKKNLGKELKWNGSMNSFDQTRTTFYKAGKYYLYVYKFSSTSDIYTTITVGNKTAIMDYYDVDFY